MQLSKLLNGLEEDRLLKGFLKETLLSKMLTNLIFSLIYSPRYSLNVTYVLIELFTTIIKALCEMHPQADSPSNTKINDHGAIFI